MSATTVKSRISFAHLPTTRKKAMSRGETRYFTGKLCPHGHIAPRRTYVKQCEICYTAGARIRNAKHRSKLKRQIKITPKTSKCSTCKIVKSSKDFYKTKYTKSGLMYMCKSCSLIVCVKRRTIEHVRKARRRWENIRYRTDIQYNLTKRMRTRLRETIVKKSKKRTWENILGYSVSDLVKRLESTLPNELDLDEALSQSYEIDHIIPLSSFCFKDVEDESFKKAWSLKNLRLISQHDNRVKSNKILQELV